MLYYTDYMQSTFLLIAFVFNLFIWISKIYQISRRYYKPQELSDGLINETTHFSMYSHKLFGLRIFHS